MYSQRAGALLRVPLIPAFMFGFQLRLGLLQFLCVHRLKTQTGSDAFNYTSYMIKETYFVVFLLPVSSSCL